MPDKTAKEIMDEYGVSKSSADLYIRNFYKLENKMDKEDMKDPKKIIKAISHLKPNTQRAYLLSVMRVLNLDDDERDVIGKEYVKLTRQLDEQRETKTREVPDLDFKRKLRMINDKINDTRSEAKLQQLLQDKLIILIHSEIPARRGMDWYDMELATEPTDEILEDDDMDQNYYNLKDFIFKKFKSVKKHGNQTLKPTKRIQRTIRMMLDLRGDDIGDHLFLNRKGKKFNNPSWNKALKRVLGYSTNDLRKIYAKQNIDTKAVKKAMEVAEQMGHSIDTASRDYYPREEPENKREPTKKE